MTTHKKAAHMDTNALILHLNNYYALLMRTDLLTEELLEKVIYSLNKHAKINRDKAYECKRKMNDIMYSSTEYQKYGIFSDTEIETLQHLDEEKERYFNIMEGIYEDKDFLISSFLGNPQCTHYSYRMNRYYDPVGVNYFDLYRTKNHSFHVPVDTPGSRLLIQPDDMFIPAAPENTILPLSYCQDVITHVKKTPVTYRPSEETLSYPGDDTVFFSNVSMIQEIIDRYVQVEIDKIKNEENLHVSIPDYDNLYVRINDDEQLVPLESLTGVVAGDRVKVFHGKKGSHQIARKKISRLFNLIPLTDQEVIDTCYDNDDFFPDELMELSMNIDYNKVIQEVYENLYAGGYPRERNIEWVGKVITDFLHDLDWGMHPSSEIYGLTRWWEDLENPTVKSLFTLEPEDKNFLDNLRDSGITMNNLEVDNGGERTTD